MYQPRCPYPSCRLYTCDTGLAHCRLHDVQSHLLQCRLDVASHEKSGVVASHKITSSTCKSSASRGIVAIALRDGLFPLCLFPFCLARELITLEQQNMSLTSGSMPMLPPHRKLLLQTRREPEPHDLDRTANGKRHRRSDKHVSQGAGQGPACGVSAR